MKKTLPLGKFFGVTHKRLETEPYTFVDVKGFASKYTPVHTHETAHFVFVINGGYNATIKDKNFLCSSTTVLYHPAGTTHRDHICSESGQFMTVSLSPKVNKQLLDGMKSIKYSTNINRTEIFWLGRKIYRELYMVDELSEIVLEGCANELLAFVTRDLDKSNKLPGWLKKAHELINDSCNSRITISEIADIIGIHPIHLARTFRRFFNCSPGEYLRQCRMNFATNLLLTSEKSLAEIALLSGFADQSQFTRSFKKNMNTTPQKFRQIHKS